MVSWLLEVIRCEFRNQLNTGGGREGVAEHVRVKVPPSVSFTSSGVMLRLARTANGSEH